MKKRLIKIQRDNGKVFYWVQRRIRILFLFKAWSNVECFTESQKQEAIQFFDSYCPQNIEITQTIRQA